MKSSKFSPQNQNFLIDFYSKVSFKYIIIFCFITEIKLCENCNIMYSFFFISHQYRSTFYINYYSSYSTVPSFKMLSNILYASPLSSRCRAELACCCCNSVFLVPSSRDFDRFRNCPSLGTSNRHDACWWLVARSTDNAAVGNCWCGVGTMSAVLLVTGIGAALFFEVPVSAR